MKTLFTIKREARQSLRPVYWSVALVCLVVFVLAGYTYNIGGVVPITLYNALQIVVFPNSPILQVLCILFPMYFFLIGPLEVGRARYFLRGIDGEWRFRNLFSPFCSRDYFRIALVMSIRAILNYIAPLIGAIIITLVTDTLVGLLIGIPLIIAGILVYYRQRLTPYILAENPELRFAETWEENEWLSDFRRFKGLFAIDFSFYTWYIAGALFFGVGHIFFFPYHQMTMALRYREMYIRRHSTESAEKEDNTGNSKDPCTNNSEKPPPALRQNPVKTLLCLAIAITILHGTFPVSTASAHDETEYIVTTEQELRDAVEQNLSPIRIDTTIALTESAITIDEEQDIVLRGTGSLVVATESQWEEGILHFIINSGRLTLQEKLSLTLDPHITYGGGVYVSGSFIMEGGRIEYNRARTYLGGGVTVNQGTFTMYDGVIRGNSAEFRGGGVQVKRGTFTMYDGAICGNSAGYGGGVYVEQCTFTMYDGVIRDNSARYGGGVYVFSEGHFVMHGGQITENHAQRNGGGICLFILSTFNMTSGEISNNHAEGFGGAIGTSSQFGYEHISISPDSRFYGNTAEGQVYSYAERGLADEVRPHRSFGLYAGYEEYPQIRWSGDNSRPGTHLINNYDIGYDGMRQLATWQSHLAILGIILLGKGIALLYFLRQDKKAKSPEEEEDAVCDAT